jgi:SAM-dependent methyltransferase
MVGGFAQNDGTIDFYLRVNSLININSIVLDFGAGRAAWYEDDKCNIRRNTRILKGKVKQLIAADIDERVINNKISDRQIIIKGGKLNIEPNSIDLIIADYVLEHIENPGQFYSQINNCLKSGGWFCARTPHKYSYVALISYVVKNSLHGKLLSYIQPDRKAQDVFPVFYKLNLLKDINFMFYNWKNLSFIYRSEPAYYFGNRFIFAAQSLFHRLLPAFACGNLFVFLQKP